MGNRLFIIFVVLAMLVCVGYTGWYFGHIGGYNKTRSQFQQSALPVRSSNFSDSAIQNTINHPLTKLAHKYADNSRSLAESKRVIDKAKRVVLSPRLYLLSKNNESVRKEFKI